MKVLGVWMWPDSVIRQGGERAAEHCAQLGVTDLFFLVKGLAGTVSCRSASAPQVCDRDLLRELSDAAHRRGMRVHAWFTSVCDAHYKTLHPESGRAHFVRGKDKGLISLADMAYLSYMHGIIREVCRNYDIDGLHLDYIRYNHLLYGWDKADLERYAAEGADIPHLRQLMDRTFSGEAGREKSCIFDALRNGDESARALARARRQDVFRFARALVSRARAENSRLLLSAALMPEGAYEDTAFADLHYGQSYEDAAELYDTVLPMAYSRAYARDGRWVREVAQGTLRYGLRTVMGLQAYEDGTGATLREDLAALQGLPVDGVCLFRYGAFVQAEREGEKLLIRNPLEKPVTAMQACGRDLPLEKPILPGEETYVSLHCAPEELRAFSEEKECPVYLAPPAGPSSGSI